MKKLIVALLLFSSLNIQAQVNPDDSLALVSFYNATDGDNWFNNDGWLDGPIDNWFGVVLEGTRIFAIELPSNNLRGNVPDGIANIGSLRQIIIPDNRITGLPDFGPNSPLLRLVVNDNLLEDLPDMQIDLLEELSCQNNFLEFDDLEDLVTEAIEFNYSPQAFIGEELLFYARPGDELELSIETGGFFNLYSWFQDGSQISDESGDPQLLIDPVTSSDDGTYVVEVTNPLFPQLTLRSRPQEVVVLQRDELGGLFVPNHMIVVFTEDASDFEKDTLRNFYQATVLDDCLCGEIELWELPDTSYLSDGNILVGVEETKESASTKSKVEDTGNNYLLDLLEQSRKKKTTSPSKRFDWFMPPPPPPPTGPVVAIIDVGVDGTHPDLSFYMWDNPDEMINGSDSDDNCLADDVRGYDFVNNDTGPNDLISGHGTHLAGIVSNNANLNELQIMPVKSHDDNGQGFLFEALCGIYYAGEQDAQVINLSWGYQGNPSTVLEESIRYFGEDCGTLFVTSAGNDGSDNDAIPHYPSSFELDNIISVAALDKTEFELAFFTNFGETSVDIAAPGTRVLSTVPGGGYEFRDGSSMAAAAVSQAAAVIIQQRPELTYLNIKEAILSSAEVLPSLNQVATSGKLDIPAALLAAMEASIDTSCLLTNSTFEAFADLGPVVAYPQPFTDNFQIQWPTGLSGEMWVSIHNNIGQTIYQQRVDARQIQLNVQTANWPAGLYHLRLQNGQRQHSTKILKQ